MATLNIDDAKSEIANSKKKLEAIIEKPVVNFAYPNGKPSIDYKDDHRDLVEESGYHSAVTTEWDFADCKSDRWQLPRFTPWDKTPLRFMVRLLLNYR